MLKTNNFNIEDYPKAARDPEQLLFPLHENPSLLFGSHSHSHSLSWSSSLPMGRPSCARLIALMAFWSLLNLNLYWIRKIWCGHQSEGHVSCRILSKRIDVSRATLN